MPKNRKSQVNLDVTPYYHCMSRCVRRAFLCGDVDGRNFDHRRAFIEQKLLFLSQVFAIDICAYAVMSNHYHVVIHVDKPRALAWRDYEVVERWHRLHKGTLVSQKYLKSPSSLSKAERKLLESIIEVWRERLFDLSCFMARVNESLARLANIEDDCTGHFWEGRFKSQALLDEQALAACMVYVDLNPVRSGMASTPAESDFTSIRRRLSIIQNHAPHNDSFDQASELLEFQGLPTRKRSSGLPFRFKDYVELLNWNAQIVRSKQQSKAKFMSSPQPALIAHLDIEPGYFAYLSQNFESRFKCLVGTFEDVKKCAQRFGYRRFPGGSACISLTR